MADSSELMAVTSRLISAWCPEASKNVWFLLSRHDADYVAVHEAKNSFSRHDVRRVHDFSLADSSELITVRLISASWPKNVWFLLSTHDVRRVHKKFSSRPFERADGCLESFWPPKPKNVWFLLSRHDVRRVHEKFSSLRFERADGC